MCKKNTIVYVDHFNFKKLELLHTIPAPGILFCNILLKLSSPFHNYNDTFICVTVQFRDIDVV